MSVKVLLDQLATAAVELNLATDSLSAAVEEINEELARLHLGVAAWVTIATGKDWERSLGYSKTSKKWGLSIRLDENKDNIHKEERWLYNEAPRWMRVEAIGHLEELLEQIFKNAQRMKHDMESTTAKAYGYLTAMKEGQDGNA